MIDSSRDKLAARARFIYAAVDGEPGQFMTVRADGSRTRWVPETTAPSAVDWSGVFED